MSTRTHQTQTMIDEQILKNGCLSFAFCVFAKGTMWRI